MLLLIVLLMILEGIKMIENEWIGKLIRNYRLKEKMFLVDFVLFVGVS